ncbi:MAG: hypothetical protein QOJ12_3118, partial [Thermoleophilales bacterium]|nr:hypothetical protein [Thermoleophilales bacterium]
MRLSSEIFIDATPEEIWEVVTDPQEQTGVIQDVTRWDVEGDQERGLGARYVMRMEVGSAEIGSTIEVVEWDETRDMAWTSVKGIDQRGRWRLRRDDQRGGTNVELRLSYQSPGSSVLGAIADRVSGRLVQGK